MPVIKIIPSHSRISRIESYLKNPNKTNPDNYFANLCDYDNVSESFQIWNQNFSVLPLNRTYYHIIISYNPKDAVSAEKCKEMTQELCERVSLKDYPYFGTVHTDTDHMHAHVLVNNRSVFGKSYQSTRNSTRELKQIANEICLREGFLHSLVDIDKKANEYLTTTEAQLILKKKQLPWKEELRHQINEASKDSSTLLEFVSIMERRYGIRISENKKGEWRYHTKSSEKPCPSRRLGEAYTREGIAQRIQQLCNEKRRIKR